MTIYRLQVSLAAATGIPADATINDFVINDAGETVVTDGGITANVVPAIAGFYNTAAAGASLAVSKYIARAASRAANDVAVKAYDITGHLTGSPAGSPVFTGAFTLGAVEPSLFAPMPAEVAACMTLRGVGWNLAPVEAPGSRPRQRHSGRVFLGPLTFGAFDEADTTGHRVRLNATFRGDVTKAGVALVNALAAIHGGVGPALAVWSRKDATTRPVVEVQVDDAADTIRSRGPKASVRTSLAVA